MNRPPYLKSGDRIAIVSPSGAIDSCYIDGAVETLLTWGLIPEVGSFARGTLGRFSGSDSQRLADLQQALDDPGVCAVLCSRGGYGAVRLLDKINWDGFIRNPKWMIGFSDITILHAAIAKLGIESLHAVMARALANYDPQAEQVSELREILFGKKQEPFVLTANPLNRFGEAEGVLTGGNLSVLYGLRGTAVDIQPEGKILFIEDLSEKLYHIDRMMQNLRLGGILSRISGLLVGHFTEIEDVATFGQRVEEVIASAVSGYSYPVAFGFPVGHVTCNMPVIHGAKIKMDVTERGSEIFYYD
jgi:muramoyltetrapeptide carboxypeptidase